MMGDSYHSTHNTNSSSVHNENNYHDEYMKQLK